MPGFSVVGGGFIGKRMADRLARAGHQTTLLSRRAPDPQLSPAVRVVIGDASNPADLTEALSEASAIVWCAGGKLPATAELQPELDRKLTLTPLENLLGLQGALSGRRLLFLSSGGTIYGDAGRDPITETHPAQPIGAYGRNRLQAERLLLENAPADLQVTALRCANVYGPGQPPDRGQGAVAVFADRIRHGEPVTLFGQGSAIRDFVHVDDVIEAVDQLSRLPRLPALVNCGSGQGVRVAELVAMLEAQLGRRADVERLPARDFEVAQIVLEISLLQSLVRYKPRSLPAGLETLYPTQVPT